MPSRFLTNRFGQFIRLRGVVAGLLLPDAAFALVIPISCGGVHVGNVQVAPGALMVLEALGIG